MQCLHILSLFNVVPAECSWSWFLCQMNKTNTHTHQNSIEKRSEQEKRPWHSTRFVICRLCWSSLVAVFWPNLVSYTSQTRERHTHNLMSLFNCLSLFHSLSLSLSSSSSCNLISIFRFCYYKPITVFPSISLNPVKRIRSFFLSLTIIILFIKQK